MYEDYLERLEELDKPWVHMLAWFGGATLFLLSAWLLWARVSVNPERVFWGTISNNLVTTGVTRHTNNQGEASTQDQYQQISLGSQNFARTTATVDAKQTDNTSTKVTTETIATSEANFSRYTSIETTQKAPNDQPFNFAPVLNIWGKQVVDGQTTGAFAEAIFGDLIPFGYLSSSDRHQVIGTLKEDKAYTVDFSAVTKRQQNGRLVYDYTVGVAPAQYIKSLKQIDKLMGLNQIQNVDETQLSSEPVGIKVTIDAHAQQLVAIEYGSSGTITFSDYGANRSVTLPDKTIDQTELKSGLNKILGNQ